MRIGIAYSNRYNIEEYSQDEKRRYFIACEGEKTEYLSIINKINLGI